MRSVKLGIACVVFLSTAVVFSLGCSFVHLPMVMHEVRSGTVSDIPDYPSVTGQQIFPDVWSNNKYAKVELLRNVSIGVDDNRSWYSFVLGKRVSDGEWEIITAIRQDGDGTWTELAVKRDL